MRKYKSGFSLVELMSVLIVMSILFAGLYKVFFSGQRQAKEIVENHVINDEIQRLVDRITDDLREGSYTDPSLPPTVNVGAETALITKKGDTVSFYKVIFDFSKNMSTMTGKTRCFTLEHIRYSVEGPRGPTTDGPPWALVRTITPWDDQNNPKTTEAKSETLLDGIDEIVFYRLQNPTNNTQSPGINTIFLRVAVKRTDPNLPPERRYSAKVVTSVKCRGSQPENLGGMLE